MIRYRALSPSFIVYLVSSPLLSSPLPSSPLAMTLIFSGLCYQLHSHQAVIIDQLLHTHIHTHTKQIHTHAHAHSPTHLFSFHVCMLTCLIEPLCMQRYSEFLQFRLHLNVSPSCFRKCGHLDVVYLHPSVVLTIHTLSRKEGARIDFHRSFLLSWEFTNMPYFTFSATAISIPMGLHCEGHGEGNGWLGWGSKM